METYGNPGDEFEKFRLRASLAEPIRIDYADRKWAPEKAYLDGLARQARAAERLSFLSPTGLFRAVASAVCRTDLASHERHMDRTRQYRETFIRWLRGKEIFSSYRWITPTDPAAFRTEDELVEMRTGGEFKTAREYEDWAGRQTDARARWMNLSKVAIPGDRPDDFPYLDISDMPRFEVREGALLSGLESSAPWLGILLVEAVLLFYVGYVAFIRYDVR
jgi:hypothetical protein